jgi:hypothetical protein
VSHASSNRSLSAGRSDREVQILVTPRIRERQSRPRRQRAATALAMVLGVLAVTLVLSASAATSASQQWVTAATVPVNGGAVGGSPTFTFGSSGISAVETNTAVSGSCSMQGILRRFPSSPPWSLGEFDQVGTVNATVVTRW